MGGSSSRANGNHSLNKSQNTIEEEEEGGRGMGIGLGRWSDSPWNGGLAGTLYVAATQLQYNYMSFWLKCKWYLITTTKDSKSCSSDHNHLKLFVLDPQATAQGLGHWPIGRGTAGLEYNHQNTLTTVVVRSKSHTVGTAEIGVIGLQIVGAGQNAEEWIVQTVAT